MWCGCSCKHYGVSGLWRCKRQFLSRLAHGVSVFRFFRARGSGTPPARRKTIHLAGVAHVPPMCGGERGWLPLGDKYARVPCEGGGGCAATGPALARLSDTAFSVQAQGRAGRWQIRANMRGSVYRSPHVRPCHRSTLPKGVKVANASIH